MNLFDSMSTTPSMSEAQAFMAKWTAALPDRLVWFRRQVPTELAAAELDQLDALLAFVAGARSSVAAGTVEPPLWWTGGFRDQFTAYGAALADGLMAVIADVIQRRTSAQWHLGSDPRDDDFRRPVLVPIAAAPWRQVLTGLARLQGGPRRPFSLRTAVELSLAAAVRASGPDSVDATEVDSAEVLTSGHPNWDLRIVLTEGASERLPAELYDGFEELLRSVPGVLDAMGEDREEFLVRTDKTLDPRALEERVNALLEMRT